jgi:hypothetical protein
MNKITRDDTEHGVEYVRADEAQAEVERLNKALTWEQNRAGRIGTHGPGCHTWGPAHFECLLREHERLKASIALDKMAENARDLGLDYGPAPVQEPVAKVYRHGESSNGTPWHGIKWLDEGVNMPDGTLLYAAPQPVPVKTYHDGKPWPVAPVPDGPYSAPIKELWPVAPKPWVGLTDEERNKIRFDYLDYDERAQAIEVKLKEKNT